MTIQWMILGPLLAACLLMLVLERRGLPTTLALSFKGDVKRETRWIAQYGQALCTLVGALLIYQLDTSHRKQVPAMLAAVFGVSLTATIIKRLLGRVRPGRQNAGQFMGPSWRHANWRESFPSSHSAGAVAFSVVLAAWYPPAATTFWALAIGCAAIRYLMDAHWPSDVLAGISLGYAAATLLGAGLGL